MERLCVFCKHLEHDDGGYGEYAEADKFYCKLGKWRGAAYDAHKQVHGWTYSWMKDDEEVNCDDLAVFRVLIKTAKSCDSYTPPEK